MIPITTIQPPTFMKWPETEKIYLENVPGSTLHVILDDYSPGDENILKKSRPESITERKISNLSQVGEWPSGLRRCNQNRKVSGSEPTRRSAGLRDTTSPRGSR